MCNEILVSLLSMVRSFATLPQNLVARQDVQDPAQAAQGSPYTQQSPEELQR